MSDYRVSVIQGDNKSLRFMKFDNKEDAEHYAKNQSQLDNKNIYEIQKNNSGEFFPIKSYQDGQVI